MKKLLLILTMLIGTSIWSFGQDPSTLQHSATSYVDDFAHAFTPEQAQDLDGIIGRLTITVQISLVTINSLNGLEPYEYATKLGNLWGVGSKSNNGLLILICPAEHKFFAATGKGIQGDLTDLMAAKIYEDYAKPKYKSGDMYGGTRDALIRYIEHLSPAAIALHSEQEKATSAENAKMASNAWNIIAWILAIIGIGTFIIIRTRNSIRKKQEEAEQLRLKKKREASELKEALAKYNNAIKEIDKISKTIAKEPNLPEGKRIIDSINILYNIQKNTSNTDKSQIDSFLSTYAVFTRNNATDIKSFNDKKTALDSGTNSYGKYNNPVWKQTYLETVNKLAAGLQQMQIDKGNNGDIIKLNNIIAAVMSNVTELKDALDKKDVVRINSILTNINVYENNFEKLRANIDNTISTDTDKVTKARHAKEAIGREIQTMLSYTTKRGVSTNSIEDTRAKCTILSNRLNEFDGLDIVKAYALWVLLHPQLETCKSAYNESSAYEAEIKRKERIKKEEEERRQDEERRRKKAIEDAARRRREEEDEEDRRRRNSYSSSSSSYSSSSSSDSSSSSSSSSSFSGGSFDGGGGGGSW